MKLRYLIGPICLLLLFAACGGSNKAEDEFTIEGSVLNHPEGSVWLEMREADIPVVVDSTKVAEDGTFRFQAKGREATLYQLRFAQNKIIGMIPEFDELQVEVDLEDLANYQVRGNVKSEMLRDFNIRQIRLFGEYIRNRRGMNLINRNVDQEKWREQEARADKSLMAFRSYLRDFADTTQFPLLSALAAMSLDVGSNYFYMQRYLTRLKEKAGDAPYVKTLEKKVAEVGEPFLRLEGEDIVGKNHLGEDITLSGLRGKVVVIYAWASYCEFSRQENLRLSKLLGKEGRDDLVIFSISIDDDPEAWKAAIEEDGLPGKYHLLGDKGWNSDPFSFYDVRSIPTTYLLDHRGIIRSKNIRAEDLEDHMDYITTTWGGSTDSGS